MGLEFVEEGLLAGSGIGLPSHPASQEHDAAVTELDQSFIYGSLGNTNGTNGSKPDWDGVVDNLPTAGGYVGLSPFVNDQFVDRLREYGTDSIEPRRVVDSQSDHHGGRASG
jgi:hypothetical protein